jgi:hypothetical protein
MNRTSGPVNGKGYCRGQLAFVPLFILVSLFLPLPLFVTSALLCLSLALHSRAGPISSPVLPARSPGPPSLRSPPF